MDEELARKIIQFLNLEPLSEEGGLFAETYRSNEVLPPGAISATQSGSRSVGTAIYYALTAEEGSFSAMHRLKTDEIYHFYLGDPVEFLLLCEDRSTRRVVMGTDLLAGQFVQLIVPANTWQGSRLLRGGTFALMGTTMAPGFAPADFTLGRRSSLQAGWPAEAAFISHLTRN